MRACVLACESQPIVPVGPRLALLQRKEVFMEDDSRLLELSEVELAIATIAEERKLNFEKMRLKELKEQLLFLEFDTPPQEDCEN